MTELMPFAYGEHQARVVTINGEPWFVARDVCAVLEIANGRDAVARLDSDEKGVALTDTPGGRQNAVTVSEAGLYSLIIRSDKSAAKPFRRWVTHEVLPQIQKTGAYGRPTAEPVQFDPRNLTDLLDRHPLAVTA